MHHLRTKQKVSPKKHTSDETNAKFGLECVAVVPPHSCKCLACHQRCICGRAGMRRIWGLAVGPRIWPWPLAGQLGPYNLGSHSPLWPGERTHTYTHQTQRQQQHGATSTTWTRRSYKKEWKLHQWQQAVHAALKGMTGRKSWWGTQTARKSAHTVCVCVCAHQKVHICTAETWQQRKLLTFSSSVCVRKRAEGAKECWRESGRERRQYGRQACLHSISSSSITLNRKVIDYEMRAEQGRAEQRAVTPACMQTTLDMLILPTSSNTQQSAKQHS